MGEEKGRLHFGNGIWDGSRFAPGRRGKCTQETSKVVAQEVSSEDDSVSDVDSNGRACEAYKRSRVGTLYMNNGTGLGSAEISSMTLTSRFSHVNQDNDAVRAMHANITGSRTQQGFLGSINTEMTDAILTQEVLAALTQSQTTGRYQYGTGFSSMQAPGSQLNFGQSGGFSSRQTPFSPLQGGSADLGSRQTPFSPLQGCSAGLGCRLTPDSQLNFGQRCGAAFDVSMYVCVHAYMTRICTRKHAWTHAFVRALRV
jgi:hypothetical protein